MKTKQPFSTAALNVHNFKGINDLFGRMRGDRVLCYMKNVLDHNLKEGEFFCRDTADLFYLLLLDTDQESIKNVWLSSLSRSEHLLWNTASSVMTFPSMPALP